MAKTYHVYIMTNDSGTLYVGMTSNLIQRVWQHKTAVVDGFTKRYRLKRLVYYEGTTDVWSAIAREKEVKKWRRELKIALIDSMNPTWRDLAADLGVSVS